MSKLLSGLRTLFRRDPPDPRNIAEISPDAAGREHDKLPCDVLVNDNFVTSSFPLASLPEDCLHVAFSHCSPRDLGRFACVSKAWKAAASVAWSRTAQPWLKPAASKFPALRIAESPSAAYSAVLKGVLSEDGSWMLSADVSTGLLSLHLAAVDAFGSTWLDKRRPTGYWEVREQVPGSSFSRCAYLNNVCWFNIEGDIDLPVAGVSHSEPGISHSEPQVSTFALPQGRYEVLWKASKSRRFRWTDVPARASVDAQGIVLIHNSPVDLGHLVNHSTVASLLWRKPLKAAATPPTRGERWVREGGSGVGGRISMKKFEVQGGNCTQWGKSSLKQGTGAPFMRRSLCVRLNKDVIGSQNYMLTP